MRIGLIAPPFISVPPKGYGGTELFVARLAEGLLRLGQKVIVYTNGESTVGVEKRSIYPRSQWPISGETRDTLKELEHASWAVSDASQSCDVIHVNNVQGVACSRFVETPLVHTLHHPHEPDLSEFYKRHSGVHYVAISGFQCKRESLPRISTIQHGIDFAHYKFRERKQQYLCFLGRIAPIKGTHLAIAVAKKAGIPLKIAGEIQPIFRDYFETQIKPHIDGKFIEYLGIADLDAKNELLGNSMAMLFPIQWDEPFGLVLIESMACGTPVLALPGGSVSEIVAEGISGHICNSVKELAFRAARLETNPASVRHYAEKHFSVHRMAAQYAELYAAISARTDFAGDHVLEVDRRLKAMSEKSVQCDGLTPCSLSAQS
jgi:glycosyltransferase involved in cell wall biosynthesis